MSNCSPSALRSKNYVFDPRPRFPFRIVAKRYWIGECVDAIEHDGVEKDRDAHTLVFLHGNGAHKEHWEVTIQQLFQHEQAASRRSVRFHDMWSIDMPNHGDSAILNEEVLRWGYDVFLWETYARGVHAFLAGLGTGVDVDFSKRKLALVGHSLGGIATLLVTTYYPLLKISSLHLFEPFLLSEKLQDWGLQFEKFADKRRDVWPSSEEAFQIFRTRPLLRRWDERILRIVAQHGLRPLPSPEHPDQKEGVTLKCPRKQEAATFRDRMTYSVGWRYLPYVLKEIPTHITYGMVMDFTPEELQQEALHIASGGISNFASVTKVPGAGHMILQTHPGAVADVMWKTLTQSRKSSPKDTVVAKL